MQTGKNLKSKTIESILWGFSERFGQQAIHFVITIILARLLTPAEFGLIAMLGVFIAVAQLFVDSGFGQALIQKQNTGHIDECSIFYFNILVSLLMAVLLCLAAPWIANFYNVPLLTPLTYALSLNLIINSFALIQTALLTKRIDFRTQMKVSLIATILSGIAGIIMAYKGFGVWSLVFQSITSNLIRTSLLWFFHQWRPTLTFSYSALQSMFPFGSYLFLSSLLEIIFQNIHLMVIGKIFSAADLGFYSRAKGLQGMVTKDIVSSIIRVTFPVFSSIQEDKKRFKAGARKALKMMAMLNFPLMVGLAVLAKPVIVLLLTDKWLPCIPYLQLFCIIGALAPIQGINLNILKALGRSDFFFKLQVLKKILSIIALFITYRWGVIAIICGQIITSLIECWLNSYYTSRLLRYSITEQIVDLAPTIGISLSMGLILFFIPYLLPFNYIILAAIQIITGITIYCILIRLFQKSDFMEMFGVVKTIYTRLRGVR